MEFLLGWGPLVLSSLAKVTYLRLMSIIYPKLTARLTWQVFLVRAIWLLRLFPRKAFPSLCSACRSHCSLRYPLGLAHNSWPDVMLQSGGAYGKSEWMTLVIMCHFFFFRDCYQCVPALQFLGFYFRFWNEIFWFQLLTAHCNNGRASPWPTEKARQNKSLGGSGLGTLGVIWF